MKNVESWKLALEKGFDPRSYTYDPAKIPVGAFEAILDFKIWAKQAMGVGCYFSQKESGYRFVLTVYRDRLNQEYRIKDCPIDFTVCAIGVTYALRVKLNGNGNPFISEARLCGDVHSASGETQVEEDQD